MAGQEKRGAALQVLLDQAAGRLPVPRVPGKQVDRRDGGFTLMELLVAIAIATVVVSLVYGAFHATFRVIRGAEDNIDVARSAGLAMGLICEDLAGAVPGLEGRLEGERHDYSGLRGDSLILISSRQVRLDRDRHRDGWSLIGYEVEEADGGGLNLYRIDGQLQPGTDDTRLGERRYLLAQGLKEFSLAYTDDGGNLSESWKSETAGEEVGLPVLVRVTLVYGDDERGDREKLQTFSSAVALPRILDESQEEAN